MTSQPAPSKLMIVDACVLIDFIKAERAVLKLVVNFIGPLAKNTADGVIMGPVLRLAGREKSRSPGRVF